MTRPRPTTRRSAAASTVAPKDPVPTLSKRPAATPEDDIEFTFTKKKTRKQNTGAKRAGNGRELEDGDSRRPARVETPVEKPEGSTIGVDSNTHVKLTHVDSFVPITTAETPMIVKNRIMRYEIPPSAIPIPLLIPKTVADTRRRSSIGMRGKRLSSRGTGVSEALPHASIHPNEFYKHVDADESEPIRLRQVLIWCIKRAKADAERDDAGLSPQLLKMYDAVISGLVDKKINTSWYHRDKSIEAVVEKSIVVKPNPENQANLEIKNELENEIRGLLAEENEWKRLLESINQEDPRSPQTEYITDVSALALTDSEKALLETLESVECMHIAPEFVDGMMEVDGDRHERDEVLVKGTEEWMEMIAKKVQFEIHSRYDTLSTLSRQMQFSQRECDSLFSSLIQAYENERTKRQEILEPMEILKMLGSDVGGAAK